MYLKKNLLAGHIIACIPAIVGTRCSHYSGICASPQVYIPLFDFSEAVALASLNYFPFITYAPDWILDICWHNKVKILVITILIK